MHNLSESCSLSAAPPTTVTSQVSSLFQLCGPRFSAASPRVFANYFFTRTPDVALSSRGCLQKWGRNGLAHWRGECGSSDGSR